MTLRVILEGGNSDTQRDDLQLDQPPPYLDRGGERYGQVLSHFDEHLRDIAGRWRYRLEVEHRAMKPGHRAIDVKP